MTQPRRSLGWLLLTVVLAPLLADLWLKWSFDQRADRFTTRSAILLSLREYQPDKPVRSRRPWLEVRVLLREEAAPNERVFQLHSDDGRYAQAHRIGETVPLWISSDVMMLTPPMRLRPFEWFPFLHIPVALIALGLGVLARMVAADAVQWLAPRRTGRQAAARKKTG